MLSSCPFVRTIAAIGLAVLAASVGPVFAQAPESTVLPTAKRLYVVAEDKEVIVEASLPGSCAGTTVTVAMFQRGGDAAVSSIYVNLDPRAQRGFKIVMMNVPGNLGFGLDETNSPFTFDEKRSLAIETGKAGIRVLRYESDFVVGYTLLTASRGFTLNMEPRHALPEGEVLKILLSLTGE